MEVEYGHCLSLALPFGENYSWVWNLNWSIGKESEISRHPVQLKSIESCFLLLKEYIFEKES
jgi:hypothetical protein